MRVTRLAFSNIRNHYTSQVFPVDNVNIFTGLNGEGKTSILEAITLCTLTRSFADPYEQNIIRSGEKKIEAILEFQTDLGVKRKIEVLYDTAQGKTIWLDGEKVSSAASIIGVAPTIVLSPDLKIITNGAPSERRRFIDIVISQAKRSYLDTLIDYRRVLKHRNALLIDSVKNNKTIPDILLEPFDEMLINLSAKLMFERALFIAEFEIVFTKTVLELSNNNDIVELKYSPNSVHKPLPLIDDYRVALWLKSKQIKKEELRRGATLFGAHRDELKIKINGLEARLSASQGQHKTLITAMKIAEFRFLSSKLGETPIILLDDIFSELDEERSEKVFHATHSLAQIFITTVSIKNIPFYSNIESGIINVKNGEVSLNEFV